MGGVKRIDVIKQQPAGTRYVVLNAQGHYWKVGDRGYSEHIGEARKWTQAEIIDRLENYGLMDKAIHIYAGI